jgi:hypothetical protein
MLNAMRHEQLHEWEKQVLAHFLKGPDMADGQIRRQDIFDR